MTLEQNIQKIREIVAIATNISLNDVLINHDNRPANSYPSRLYCTIHPSDPVPVGAPSIERVDNGLDQETTVTVNHVLGVEVNFYKQGALQASTMLNKCEWLDNVMAYMYDNEIGIRSFKDLKNSTELQNGQYEERSTITGEFYIVLRTTYTNGNIQSVEVNLDPPTGGANGS